MRFDLDPGDAATKQINAYEDHRIQIDTQWYQKNIIISGNLVIPWAVQDIQQLSESDLTDLIAASPEVILFGTGNQLMFLDQKLQYILLSHHIGVEVMTTQAACRTYNILVSEGRRVLACLVID